VNTSVHRDADRVWLEGVRGWSPHEQHSSVHAAQAAVMGAVGEDVTYDYLLGVSGLAFRMQVSKKTLCPSSPHSSLRILTDQMTGDSGQPRCGANRCGGWKRPCRWSGMPFGKLRWPLPG
jgi:hypothetical protein